MQLLLHRSTRDGLSQRHQAYAPTAKTGLQHFADLLTHAVLFDLTVPVMNDANYLRIRRCQCCIESFQENPTVRRRVHDHFRCYNRLRLGHRI